MEKFTKCVIGIKTLLSKSILEQWRKKHGGELGSLAFLSHHKNIVHLFYIVYDSVDDRHSARPPLGFAMELMAGSVAVSDSLSLGQQLRVRADCKCCQFRASERGCAFRHKT